MIGQKSIGGYFELELPQGEEYHKNAIRLNTGRNAFEYVLRAKKYKKVYLPYYTCDVMLEPIKKLGIDYEFYHIDENFLPVFEFSKVNEKNVFVYTNYFGICDKQVHHVLRQCENLIIDNSQSFFSKPLQDVDTFYSPRKFFGVSDGAYLYTDEELELDLEQDVSLKRFEHLLGRIEHGAEKYYQKFKDNDDSLIDQPIKMMSNLTRRLLQSIDYSRIAQMRTENALYLHDALKGENQLRFELKSDAVPMVYPFLPENGSALKKLLIQNKVFVATYWPNVSERAKECNFELKLLDELVAIAIDQRYLENDINKVVSIIKTYV